MADTYRVVYGETIPAWEQTFPSLRAAKDFAREHKRLGDIVFSIRRIIPGEGPQSMAAAIQAGKVDEFLAAAH